MPIYLAIDPGRVTVGLAVTDPTGAMAVPLGAIPRRPHQKFLAAVGALAAERQAEALVVGLPLEPDGRRGKEAQRAMALAHELKSRLGLDVLFADESYSTIEALELLNSPGAAKKAGPGAKDSFAAAVILERKLEGLRRGAAKKGDRG